MAAVVIGAARDKLKKVEKANSIPEALLLLVPLRAVTIDGGGVIVTTAAARDSLSLPLPPSLGRLMSSVVGTGVYSVSCLEYWTHCQTNTTSTAT